MSIESFELDEQRFTDLLGKLIGEARHLQNNPPELVPKEDRGAFCRRFHCLLFHLLLFQTD